MLYEVITPRALPAIADLVIPDRLDPRLRYRERHADDRVDQGFATFHGGLETPKGEDYAKAKGQYLIMHGTADTSVTLDDFCTLASELEAAGLKHEMVTYT